MANPNATQRTMEQENTPVVKERRFLVKEEAQIPRGGSHFLLRKGKVISSLGYDIQTLKNQGVKLEEVQTA
jgi:hypothetical protein